MSEFTMTIDGRPVRGSSTAEVINPATGKAYDAEVVRSGDFYRVMAEFWADGPKSETPPGHWNTIANLVSDELSGNLRIGGSGTQVDRLEWDVKLYLALNGAVFKARRVKGYQDWGTIHEWRLKLEGRKLFLVSLDGFLFERGSAYFGPSFDKTAANPAAVEAVKGLGREGHAVIYLSVRPREFEAATREALTALELPEGPVVMGCGVAQWNLVTSPDATLPFTTSRAIEVSPDDPNLSEKLDGLGRT